MRPKSAECECVYGFSFGLHFDNHIKSVTKKPKNTQHLSCSHRSRMEKNNDKPLLLVEVITARGPL